MWVEYDRDVFTAPPGGWITVARPALHDRPRPGTDCNGNFIDDALDLNGLIARGPYTLSGSPRALAAADFDGDGDADLVVAYGWPDNYLSILWQGSYRIYEEGTSRFEVLDNPCSVAAADFDLDEDPDIAVGYSGSKSVSVLRNDGAGGFRRDDYPISEDPSLSWPPLCVTAADMDNDGYPDLLAASGVSPGNRMVTLMRNNGDGTCTFGAPQHVSVPLNNPDGLVAADLDDDGDQDLAVVGHSPRIVIVENPGTDSVSFEEWPYHSLVDIDCISVSVGDLNGDNVPDFVVQFSGHVSVLIGGPGRRPFPDRWVLSASYPLGNGGQLVLTDLDLDNDLDIVVSVYSDDTLAILINHGDGTFADARFVPLGDEPGPTVTGDFDRDLRPELAIAHRESRDVWVLHVRPRPVSEDCNENGIPDSCDIEDDPDRDGNRDGVLDECQ